MIGCDASKLALNRKYFKDKKTMEQEDDAPEEHRRGFLPCPCLPPIEFNDSCRDFLG